MTMVFCRACAKELHETAPTCIQCGASQHVALAPASVVGSPWLAIVSMVLGILCLLSLFDDSDWDKDTLFGLGLFCVAGFVCGIISINQKNQEIISPSLASSCRLLRHLFLWDCR